MTAGSTVGCRSGCSAVGVGFRAGKAGTAVSGDGLTLPAVRRRGLLPATAVLAVARPPLRGTLLRSVRLTGSLRAVLVAAICSDPPRSQCSGAPHQWWGEPSL